jgi:hypothetical protein
LAFSFWFGCRTLAFPIPWLMKGNPRRWWGNKLQSRSSQPARSDLRGRIEEKESRFGGVRAERKWRAEENLNETSRSKTIRGYVIK